MSAQQLASWHLGALHGYEAVLLALIAFGPFVVLGVVVFLSRRRDIAAESPSDGSEPPDVPPTAPPGETA